MEPQSAKPESERLSAEQIRSVYRQGEAAVVELVLGLQERIDQLLRVAQQVEKLQARVEELEARLAQNSSNSHKPPSSDTFNKPAPKSLRQKSSRKPGRQPGHVGRTLEQVSRPDRIIPHRLDRCPCGKCDGRSLREQPLLGYEKRQVFELPETPLVVSEHRAEIKVCPVSGKVVRARLRGSFRAALE